MMNAPLFLLVVAPVLAYPATLRGGVQQSAELGKPWRHHVKRELMTRHHGPGDIRGEKGEGEARRSLGETTKDDLTGGSFEFIGCFVDLREDRILDSAWKSSDMDPMACHEYCDNMGAAYMGLQYGEECWCGMHGDLEYERHGKGTCDLHCSGDDDQTCGGHYAFDLYKLSSPAAADDDEYVACFNDVKADRIMDEETMITRDDMTPEICRDHCIDSYSIFYGLQYGTECWCGASSWLSDYDRNGEGECHVECSGDPDIACGGYETFSLFRYLHVAVSDDDRPDDDENGTPFSPDHGE